MKWKNKIEQWLRTSDTPVMLVGDKPLKWIKGMDNDLKRWGFPVKVAITNPVVVSGKVLVHLERTTPQE